MSIPYTDLNQLYVDGQWRAPAGGTEPVINPATEEVIGHAPLGAQADIDAAIAAARRAFDLGSWPQTPLADRIAVIRKFKDGIVRRADSIKQLLTAEVGAAALLMGSAHFQGALDAIDYALELAHGIKPEPSPIELKPNPFNPGGPDICAGGVTVREPYGVVVGITPYNYPLLLNLVKTVPALLAGNTVILKPSQFTPFSALLLAEIAEEAGLPPGALNIVTGGPDTGAMLTSDPRVDLVSFTGSDTVGAAILAQTASSLKKVHLELGGKSAMIVRPDADLMMAAGTAAFSFTLHAGQGCALLTRYIVHNSIRPQFVDTVKQILGSLKMGDPADPSVVVGPLISEAARQKTERFVARALEEGAQLVAGGRRPAHLRKGYFYEPTLFDNVDNRSFLAQQEVFGPIGAVIGYDTDDEAIALANDSPFGLSGAIMSADRATAYRMALKLRTGGVSINGGTGDLYVRAPFGGYKRSGIGREFGPQWLNEFMLEKIITYPIG